MELGAWLGEAAGKVCLSPERFQPLPRDSRLYLELLGWHGG